MWEDDHNAQGGKWVVVVSKQDRHALDALWEGVLLSIVGETIGESEELCGAVCSVRKKADKIAVWTKNKTNEAAIMEIGNNFKLVIYLVFSCFFVFFIIVDFKSIFSFFFSKPVYINT